MRRPTASDYNGPSSAGTTNCHHAGTEPIRGFLQHLSLATQAVMAEAKRLDDDLQRHRS
jgi:hypothetical protein